MIERAREWISGTNIHSFDLGEDLGDEDLVGALNGTADGALGIGRVRNRGERKSTWFFLAGSTSKQ